MEVSKVKEFYNDAKVFITGATGFVGKTLIEKLLRDTDVDTIYILIREKKGKTTEERLNRIFENPLFDVLKSQKPDYISKIKAVIGECGIGGLTMSDIDKETLKTNVNIIFHSAATVNFNENLKTAYEINVKGTQTLLDLAKEMPKFQAFVYVSTAYAHSNKEQIIEEKVYEYPFGDAITKIEKSTKEGIESETNKIIGNWPNSYTFTKAITEVVLNGERSNLPIGIFRPTIITSTYKEPIPGWVDNIYGVNGINVGVLTGFLRVILSGFNSVMDVVPIDKCISALIVAAWEIGEKGRVKENEDILVYNYSGKENPLPNGLTNYLNFAFGTPSSQAIWFPVTICTTNEIIFWILSIFLEIIPAFFMDALILVTGNKPRLVSLYMKVVNFMIKVKFFSLREWEFDNSNVQALWRKINKVDQELFPFNMAELSWVTFSKTYCLGLRRYILKEDDSGIPQAWTKYYRLKGAHLFIKGVFIYLVFHVINAFFSKIYITVTS